ncbi:carbonic anhydrase [Rathayibacter soli]|uniref:carbonic anhydrase n=1 Tax=Rathayibacter soli TaxID=3144168 RepID=UPI0027E53D8F|nr:carbonic anhydrase [Glaciibacter superstes]
MEGNARFVAGSPIHPHQDLVRRTQLAHTQNPIVAIFACSDSRLAVEIIFDLGLGDEFVIRNAGQVVTNSALASIEFAVAILHVPLVLVLSHEACGAVAAAIASQTDQPETLPPLLAELIAPIIPAVTKVGRTQNESDGQPHPIAAGQIDAAAVGREHLRNTITEMIARSEVLRSAINAEELAVVGANYSLQEGLVTLDPIVGLIDGMTETVSVP